MRTGDVAAGVGGEIAHLGVMHESEEASWQESSRPLISADLDSETGVRRTA